MTPGVFVVAIDGPAGAGKSTLARMAAARLGMRYLDTGALYRALACHMRANGIPPVDDPALEAALDSVSLKLDGDSVLLNGEDISDAIRSPVTDSIVSAYAALPSLRKRLLSIQHDQVGFGPLIADGRDMGTVVFPDADVKIFLTASDEVRAARRLKEQIERGEEVTYEQVLETIRSRDRTDSERSAAPLRKADGAVEVNTDELSIEQAVEAIASIISRGRGGAPRG